jgi:hypothetical protein
MRLSFDEDIVYDETGNIKDIFVHNVTWVEGKIGKALHFNGMDSYIKISNSPSVSLTNAITVEAWVKCGESPDGKYRTIVGKNGAYAFRFDDRGDLEALIWQHGKCQSSGVIPSTIAWVPNEWVYWVFTFDGAYMRIYKNGDKVIERPLTGKIDISDADLGIGATGDGHYHFVGSIDEIRIYNRALSAEEIKTRYLQGVGYGNIVFLGSTSLPKGKVMLYKATSSVVWKEGQSSLRINEVAVIPAYNNKDVQLHIKLWSDRNQKITIIVNTYQFSKILEAHLIPGLNDLKFNFSYLLPDGKSYGSQIQGWSDVIIIDADGNIAFHDVLAAFVMRRNTLPIYTWILFLALIIALFMFLDR